MLTHKQLDKLSDFFMDLAKGSFLAGFALTPIVGKDWLLLVKAFSLGIGCIFASLFLIKKKKR